LTWPRPLRGRPPSFHPEGRQCRCSHRLPPSSAGPAAWPQHGGAASGERLCPLALTLRRRQISIRGASLRMASASRGNAPPWMHPRALWAALSSPAPLCVDKCRALTLTGPLSDGAGCAVLCHAALYRAAGPDPCGAGHSLHEAPGPCTSGAGACWLHFHLGRALAPAHSLHEAPGPLGRAASGARLCTLALGLSLRRRQIAICGASRCMGSGSPGPCTSGAGACWLHFRLGPYLGAGGVFVASLRRPAFFFVLPLLHPVDRPGPSDGATSRDRWCICWRAPGIHPFPAPRSPLRAGIP